MSYGFKISRKGFDVKTCADNELLVSSSFPVLKLHSSGLYEVTADVGVVILTTHDLGYTPFYLIHLQNSAGNSEFDPNSAYYITMESNTMNIDTTVAVANGYTHIRWAIYYLDIFKEVDYGNINTMQTTRVTDNDYGIKVSKAGKDVSSTDPRDLALDSRMRSLMVHKVINIRYIDGAGMPSSRDHGLKYPPIYVSFEKYDSDNLTRQIVISDAPFNAVTDSQVVVLNTGGALNTTSSTLSFVIFKDPISLAI